MACFTFDERKAYKFISVKGNFGQDLSEHNFFRNILNCIAVNFRWEEKNSDFYFPGICMTFVQKSDGTWIRRPLHVGGVSRIFETESVLEIYTNTAVYVFEAAFLREPTFLDEASVLELYMSFNEVSCFGKGYFYDALKNPHELYKYELCGKNPGPVFLQYEEGSILHCSCTYQVITKGVEFHVTPHREQNSFMPMVIHNTGDYPILIWFHRGSKTWTILPGETKRIIPFDPYGASIEEKNKNE